MKLPNGDHAIVEIRKLLEYCLNSQHPRGRNKARVFASVGIREADAEELRTAFLAAAGRADVELGVANVYGHRYTVGKSRENSEHLDCAGRGRLAATDELLCTMNRTNRYDGH